MPESRPIIKTKFFLPPPTSDFVERRSLISKLENLKTLPLMLVSASTGYGKSTLIANHLSKLDDNYIWLSLSEKENVIQQFIKYFITAIQGKIKCFGEEVLELIHSPEPPSVDELTELLINDMADFNSRLYFALDDYHLIRNHKIHQFITKLFEFPQPYFRLIIITRYDPELPLPEWLSKNKLIEIRSSDLKFNQNEIAEFYEKAISYHPDDNTLKKLEEVTDGWISGLRLLTLSTDNKEELQQYFLDYKYKDSRVIQMLVDGILKHLSEQTREKLLRLSLLKEFNVDLFSELCLIGNEKENKEVLFNDFISEVIKSNMFIIALDDKHKWYRFHHLFIEQLYKILNRDYEDETISKLSGMAADWFHKNNILDEAIDYYLNANQVLHAIDVFTEYRLKLISQNRFDQLEIIFNLFPQDLCEKNGILLVTKGWILLQKGNIPQMAFFIKSLEQMLPREGHPQELLDLLLGEVHAMKAFDRYLSDVDIQACLVHSEKAIKLLKDQNPYALGIAWVYYGVALYLTGKPARARKELYNKLENSTSDILKGQILIILSYLDWFDCNLVAMQQTSSHLLKLGIDSGINYLIASGNILLGIAYYYQNQDEKALGYLETAHRLRYYALQHMSFPAGMALANVYAKSGKKSESNTIIQTYEKIAIEQSGKLFINITKSTSSKLALKYNNELFGLKWAKENNYKDFLPLANLYSPELVQAHILAQDNDPVSLRLAQNIISSTISFFKDRKDNNVLLRAFVIKALVSYKEGDVNKSFDTLRKAINLSSIGNYFRPYIELGEPIKELLIDYKEAGNNNVHLDEIIQNFVIKPLEEVILSNREKQILSIAEKLTNMEVAEELFLSEQTIKTHLYNIYKKLGVGSKRNAINKAKELGLI